MKKVFISFVFLFLMFFSFSLAYAKSEVYTEVRTEATGDNASVHTEITNVVNQKEVKVESDEQGEIKVEVKDGEVKVESDTESSPTVVITDSDEEEITEEKSEEERVMSQVEEIQTKIFSFFENFFSRLRQSLIFWR